MNARFYAEADLLLPLKSQIATSRILAVSLEFEDRSSSGRNCIQVGAPGFIRGERLSSLATSAFFFFAGFSRGISHWKVPGLNPQIIRRLLSCNAEALPHA